MQYAPIRSSFWGWLFIFFSLLTVTVGLRFSDWRGMLYFFAPLAVFLLLSGMRLRLPDPMVILRRDSRPPILYLRGFHDDSSGQRSWGLRTDETSLVRHLRSLGPVLALGKPGARLPERGAHRVYVTNADWQIVAGRLMKLSQLVLIRGALSPGVEWELRHVRANLDPRRVVLWIPSRSHNQIYRHFGIMIQECWGVSLPRKLNEREFVAFSAQWEPQTLRSIWNKDDSFRMPFKAPKYSLARLLLLDLHSEIVDLLEMLRRRRQTVSYDPGLLQAILRGTSPSEAPPFRLSPLVLVLLALTWACICFRPSLLLGYMTGISSSALSALLECLVVGALAASLSFFCYLRYPTRSGRVTLAFCLVLLADLVTMPWR